MEARRVSEGASFGVLNPFEFQLNLVVRRPSLTLRAGI
jgi:hypothetical protein